MAPLDAAPWAGAGFVPDLFNGAAYAGLHAPGICVEFPGLAVFRARQTRPGLFRSPGCAPYGGFDVSPGLDGDGYTRFVRACEATLGERSACGVEVGLPPLAYDAVLPERLVCLSRLGYRVIRQELNQAIPLRPGPAPFRRGPRRALAKAERAGMWVDRLTPGEHDAAYAVLEENRRKKGRRMAMSFDAVRAMTQTFPDHVHLFGARLADRLIAAAIVVAVNPRVLYVHAWGEARDAEALTPVTALAAHLHGFAVAGGFRLLDLGTSSVDGIADPGLIAFKRSLGAAPGLKLWLGKALPG